MNEQLFIQLAAKAALDLFSNPDAIKGLNDFFNSLAPCHAASDVAQDALDAWEHGQLSTEACKKIIEAVLDDRATKARPVEQRPDLAAILKQLN